MMAASALLQRYRATYASALAGLNEAFQAVDLLLIHRSARVDGLAWTTFAPRVLGGAAYLRLLLTSSPGRGVGDRLLARTETIAGQRVPHLYLLTTTDHHVARRFYERHGYRPVGDL